MSSGRFVRLEAGARRRVELTLDGRAIEALEGDSLLVALLASTCAVRESEFGAWPARLSESVTAR